MAKDMSLIWQMGVANAAGVYSALESATKKLKQVDDASKKLTETQKKLENVDKVATAYKNINLEYNKAAKNLEQLRKAYDKSNNVTAEFKEQVKNAEKQVDKLNKQKERQKHIFEAARSELEKEGLQLQGYKKKLEEVNKELKKQDELQKRLNWVQAQNSMIDKIKSKGSEQIRSGLTIGAGLAIPVKMYMDVEESQADLRKILGKEAEKYYDDLAEISKNSPLSQIEVNEIAGSLAQSGIKGEDIVEYADMAGKMKVAFDISTDEAGEFLAKTKEQLHLSKDELFSYMDTMNMLSNNYSVSAAQLTIVSRETGGLARTIGLAKESNMAFATSLISTGTSADKAGTVLGKLYSELSQGANTKNKAAALDHLGLNSHTINEEMARDAEGTILKVLERIKNSNAADKSALISDIFGSDKNVINGLATLSENLDDVREKLGKAKQEVLANESVNGEYEDRLDTLSNQLKILRNNFVNMLADIGKSVGPQLKETVKSLTVFMAKVGNFVKENPKLVASMLKLFASIAVFNLSMGGFNRFLMPLGKIILWGHKFNAFRLRGGILFGLKKMFPLTTWVLGGFKKLGLGVGKTFLTIYKTAMVYASNLFIGLKMYFANAVSFISTWGLKIGKLVGNSILRLGNGLLKFGNIIRKVLTNGLFKFIKAIKMVGLALKTAFLANPVGLIILAIIAVIAILVTLYKKCEWFRNMVNAVWQGIKIAFSVFWEWIKNKFFSLINIGAKAWNGLREGGTVILEKIKTAFSNFFDWLPNKFKSIGSFFSKMNPFNWFGRNKVAQNWTGTNYFRGGLTTLAERGPELIEMNNNSYLAGAETLANLPRGTRILNNSQTKKTLSGRVANLTDRIKNLSNNNSVSIGGNNITININGANRDPVDIATAVRKVILELESRQRRTAI